MKLESGQINRQTVFHVTFKTNKQTYKNQGTFIQQICRSYELRRHFSSTCEWKLILFLTLSFSGAIEKRILGIVSNSSINIKLLSNTKRKDLSSDLSLRNARFEFEYQISNCTYYVGRLTLEEYLNI